MFTQMAQQLIAGEWKASHWIAPVSMNIARLAPFGPNVSVKAKRVAGKIVWRFASGKQKSPFKGPVYDQSGTLMVPAGVQPSADFEQNITWLVRGMIGRTK